MSWDDCAAGKGARQDRVLEDKRCAGEKGAVVRFLKGARVMYVWIRK